MLFSAAASQQPIQFGSYLLTECVGQGGMAVVYKATRHGPNGFQKTVVVKAMLPALTSQREFVAMFSGEARLMAQLTHPNIVQVHDYGVVDGIPYLAMEYLPGRNLSQLRAAVAARGMRMPVGCALAIARDVCHGLGYAHDFVDRDGKRRQIIHRDISPSNVMVCRDGSVKLLDFGVAKIIGEFDHDVTQSFKGKYAYMSPEQVSHRPIDRRADVFAAGIVLHELLSGKRLFAAPTELETLQRVAAAQVVAPSVDNRDVPRALDAIVKKALAREPADRYASGTELAEALETLDALAWSRKRLAAFVCELFANDWMIVCEVCGKQVLPGTECEECGTEAPSVEAPVAVDPEAESHAVSARQALRPLYEAQGDTNVSALPSDTLPALTAGGSEPLPLPPPPLMSRSKSSRARLALVRTPLPPPVAPPPADKTEETAMPPVADDGEAKTAESRIEPASVPPPGPPRLFVVPKVETQTPLPPPLAVLSTPRPAGPQPLFVVPQTPSGSTVRIKKSPLMLWYTTAAAAIGVVALAVALLVRHPAPDDPSLAATTPTPAATATTPAPTVNTSAPTATTPAATASTPAPTATARAPMATTPAPTAATSAAKAHEPSQAVSDLFRAATTPATHELVPPAHAAPSRTSPPRHRVARPRVAAAPSPSPEPSEPERTVKEGRIVDPFAGVQ